MFNQKRLAFGAACVALLFGIFVVFNGKGRAEQENQRVSRMSNQSGLSAKELDDAARPTVDFENPATVDSNEKTARKLKNSRYDKHRAVVSQPGRDTSEVIWDAEWARGLSDLPAEKSDLVVEGIVTDSKAFLSEDKGGVYSEFIVSVSRVLKVSEGISVNLGGAIVMERFGGKVRYPSGQVVLYRIEGQGAPIPGKQYLFFLANTDHGNYKLLTAYEIQGQAVFALDGSRINFRGKGNWKFDQHNGEDLASFIGKVERTINNSQAGGNRP
jgi:hypothetical protein